MRTKDEFTNTILLKPSKKSQVLGKNVGILFKSEKSDFFSYLLNKRMQSQISLEKSKVDYYLEKLKNKESDYHRNYSVFTSRKKMPLLNNNNFKDINLNKYKENKLLNSITAKNKKHLPKIYKRNLIPLSNIKIVNTLMKSTSTDKGLRKSRSTSIFANINLNNKDSKETYNLYKEDSKESEKEKEKIYNKLIGITIPVKNNSVITRKFKSNKQQQTIEQSDIAKPLFKNTTKNRLYELLNLSFNYRIKSLYENFIKKE